MDRGERLTNWGNPTKDQADPNKLTFFNLTEDIVRSLLIYEKIKKVLDNEKIQPRDRIEYATALIDNIHNLKDILIRKRHPENSETSLMANIYGDNNHEVYKQTMSNELLNADRDKYIILEKKTREEVKDKLADFKKKTPAKTPGFLSRLFKKKYSYTKLPKETLQGSSQSSALHTGSRMSNFVMPGKIPPFNSQRSRESGVKGPGSRASRPGMSTIQEEEGGGGGTRKRQRRKGHYRTRKNNTRRKVKHSSTLRRRRKT